MKPRCPTCGQSTVNVRLGVRMTPLKARLFDAIKRAGPDGIDAQALIHDLGLPITVDTCKAHCWQLNAWYLAGTGYAITGSGGVRAYRLVRVNQQAAE